MENLYARTVFFTEDAERALGFYTERLGFSVDWKFDEDGRTFVFQVSLLGFELILNQTWEGTGPRAGHGRLFIGLEDQAEALVEHVVARGIQARMVDWGKPTLAIQDLDGNEIFFWPPADDWSGFALPAAVSSPL